MRGAAEFMRRAITLSHEHMVGGEGGPFGAVIVREQRVIAEGWNMVVTANDPTAHAEVVAIRRACAHLGTFILRGCDIYTSCEPCPMCLAAIYWARLDRVFYANDRTAAAAIGFDDEFLYYELSAPIKARKLPMIRLLGEEARAAFAAWQAKPDKVPY